MGKIKLKKLIEKNKKNIKKIISRVSKNKKDGNKVVNKRKIGKDGKNNLIYKKSFKKELLISLITVSIVPIILVSILSVTMTEKIVSAKIEGLNEETTNQMNENLNNILGEIVDTTYVTLSTELIQKYVPNKSNSGEETEKIARIREQLTTTRSLNGFKDFFIIYEDGTVIGQTQSSAFFNDKIQLYKDLSNESKDGYVWLTGYADNYEIMYLLKRINSKALLVSGVSVEDIHECFKNIGLNDYSTLDMIDSKGKIVYSSTSERIGSPMEYSDLMKDEEIKGSFSSDGYRSTYIKGDNFTLVYKVSENYLFGEMRKVNKIILVFAFIILVVVVIVGNYISNKAIKPVNHIVKLMKKVEKGDFTVSSDVKDKNEFGDLSESFNVMVRNVNNLIKNIMQVSIGIEGKIKDIDNISNTSSNMSKHVTSAVEDIALGSNEQVKQADETIVVIDNLANSINVVTDSIDKASEKSSNSKVIGNDSLGKMNELKERTEQADRSFEEIKNTINTLISKIKNIEMFLKVIDDITSQTNLLAMNAQIEATHAGIYGKSFTVVASEVKKLAEESKNSTEEISKVIEDIQKETIAVSEIITNSTKVFKDQKNAVEYTSKSFNDIILATDEITDEMANVKNSVTTMNRLKENSIEAIQVISAVAEETSSNTEEVSASAEEQAALAIELANLALELTKEAGILKKDIEKFKINE